MPQARCETCRFWFGVVGNHKRECRRYPPHPTAENDYWPYTHKDTWCGEHKEKADE